MSLIRATHGHGRGAALAELAGSIAELLSEMSAGVARTPDRDRDRRLAGPLACAWRTTSSTPGPSSTRRWPSFAWTSSAARRLRRSCRRCSPPSPTRWPSCVPSPARCSTTSSTGRRGCPPASPRCCRALRSPTGPRAEALQGDDPNVDAALDAVRQARRESLRSLRRVDETGSWVVSGAILTEVDRMVQQLEGDAPALDLHAATRRGRARGFSRRSRS